MKTDKLLPLLTKINKDKQLLNKSKPNLRIPNKTQAKLESDFKLNPFIRANSQSFNLGINPTLDFGKFSVGPYGVAGGPYDDPRLLQYGVRGSYDINPNMSISGDVNPNSFRLGLNYKFQNGRQTGTPGTPNYREMAIAQGIAPADYDKNKAIIDELLTEVILPGKYDPGFMTRAKIAIARSKYPNIDTIIANIDKGTYQEGGPTIKQMINSEHGQWMFPNQITGIKGGSFNQAGDYSTSLTGEGMLHNLLVLNPYGVKQLSPGTKQVSFPGNYQLEIPQARTGGSLPIAQEGTEQQRQWLISYLKSPMYKERLKQEFAGKDDKFIDAEANARLNNVLNTKINYVPSIGRSPGWIAGVYVPKQYKGENFNFKTKEWEPNQWGEDGYGHGYDRKSNIYLENDYRPGSNWGPYEGFETIPLHEIGHSLDDGGYRIPLSTEQKIKNYTNIDNSSGPSYRNKGNVFGYYDQPTEFINRIQPIRYLLNQQGIYDARKSRFTDADYDKMIKNKSILKNQHYQDVMDTLKGDEKQKRKAFIDIMNTIAMQNSQNPMTTAKRGGSLPMAQDGLYARALQQYNDLKSGPAEAWNGDPAMVNPQGGLNLCLDCTRVDWENEADIRDVNRLIEEGYSMGTHENLDAYNNSLKKFNLTQPQYNSKSISQTATPQNRYGGLPKAQNGYEQAKAKYIELSQKGPMFQKQMQDLVKQFPLLANDVMVSAAGAISPAQQQNVKDAANRVVTNTLGRVISTPQSRADEERAKYVKEHPEKFREVAWIGKNGEVTQKSDPERGIAVPDMVLPEWQNPINYIGAARGLITNIGKGALNLTGLGTRTLSNAFNTPIIPNAAGLGARLGMTPTNYYNFAQAVNPITIGRVLTGMGLYEGAKNAPAYVNLIGDTYNTGVDAYNNKPGASEEFKKNAWNLAKQTGYYGLLAYGAKDLAKVPGLMKGVYDAEQVAEKVPTLYNKFSNWWHSDLPHNNYFGSFGNNVGLAEDLVNLEQEQPKIATLLNTAEEDIKFSKKWLEKKVRSETKSQLAPKDDKNVNQGTTDAGDLIQPGASGKIYAQNMGPFKFQYSPVDSSQGETLYNVAANSGINSNPLMFKYLQSNNMKTKFQDGGSSQEQQVAQLIQMYAQMTGMQPEDIVEKLKSLPQDQQQQALQSIAQEVQQAMAQQQQQGGAGQMGMAQDGKQIGNKSFFQRAKDAYVQALPGHYSTQQTAPMENVDWNSIGNNIGTNLNNFMKTSPLGMLFSTPIFKTNPSEEYGPQVEQYLENGGEPCFDCFDNYNPSPQAQNLEWFYKKAKGGLAKAAAGNEGECPTGYIRDHGGRCIPGPDLKNANRYRVYDPAIDSENPVDDLSIVNAIKRGYLGDNSVQNSARMGIFNFPGFYDAIRLGYGSLGAFSPDIADEMSRRDSIENAHALELNKRLGLPDFTHRKQVLEKKSGGNTYMMDDLYQPGRQVKTKPEPPNYQPNWLARRTSVPGQILAGIGNTLPYFGSIMGKGVYDIAFNGGKPAYVPNTDITYDDLSYYMMNRRYLNQDPNPTYDKIIQNLTPEELEQISGPIFKGGGQSFNEAFPQAQTYLPYDRPGETRPNFMFAEGGDTDDQWGGQPDIDQIYNVMKKGGMAKDPKKKNGKDWDPNDFLSYMRSGGGLKKKVDIELPKHDLTGPVTGKYKDPNPKSPWTYDYQNGKWTGYNKGKSYDISKYQSSVDILNKAYPDVVNPKTTTDPFDAGNVYGTTESKADEGYVTNDPGVDALDASGANTDPNNPNKKQNKKQPMRSLINPRDLLTGAAMQSKNKAGFLPTIAAAVNTIGVIGDVARGYGNLGRLAGSAFKSNKGYTPMPAAPAGYTDYNPPSSAQSAPMSFSNIPSPYEQFNQEASDPNSMYYNPSVKRKGGRIELPKKQMWKSQVAGSEINPSKSAYLMPDAGGLREGAIYDEWSKKNPMRTMDSFYQANTATDAQGNELYSYRPGSDADPNSPTFNKDTGKPEFNKDAGKKGFNLEYNPVEAERASASLLQINSVLAAHNQNKEDRANEWNMKGSERINPVQGAMDQGDYLTNSPQGNDFRPNQHTFAQDPGRGYNNQQLQNVGKSIYSKHGGSIWDRYREDEEIDLDDLTLEDLREIYANGGTIEFLD